MIGATPHMIGIIDYGTGNLFSLEKALKRIQVPYIISALPNELEQCDRFILPGVGHFDYGMQQLREKNLTGFIHRQVREGRLLLGICLGMQLLCKSSEEGDAEGLSLVEETVTKMQVRPPYKIPHIGWNTVSDREHNPLFMGIGPEDRFYFTHSFAVHDPLPVLAGKTVYGDVTFNSCIQKENVFGVQFHPEKSFDQGLRLLSNFISLNI
jgi:imidazole glycerol-phosphate synthase subunit HisH